MTATGKKGFDILDIDRRIIYLVVVILLIAPLLSPLALPIRVNPITRDFFNEIDNLPPGSVVLLEIDIESGLVGELGAATIALGRHLFSKPDIKFIQVCFYRADAAIIFENTVLPAISEEDRNSKEYGVDWVNLGYIEGHETAMSALADDFLFPNTDAYGNSLAEMEIFNEVRSMADVDLYAAVGERVVYEALRQMVVPYEKHAVAATMAMSVPDLMVYYNAGIVKGIIPGLAGTAQYEYLIKKPGTALPSMDALSVAHIFLLLLITVTNIVYYTRKQGGIA
jgi:hypothetical protein